MTNNCVAYSGKETKPTNKKTCHVGRPEEEE
jgi:hypothetical protein